MNGGYFLEMDLRSEQILLAQAREGNAHSFARLVEANSAAVYRHALRMVGNSADAEELAQEAFIRLHRSLVRFRGESRVSTWLYRTVSRLAIDHLRREKIRRVLFVSRGREEEIEPLELVVDEAPLADQKLLEAEHQRKVLRQLQRLSPRQRAVFSLRHFEEQPLKEIAEILGLELGTVKAHLHRAVAQLREFYAGEEI